MSLLFSLQADFNAYEQDCSRFFGITQRWSSSTKSELSERIKVQIQKARHGELSEKAMGQVMELSQRAVSLLKPSTSEKLLSSLFHRSISLITGNNNYKTVGKNLKEIQQWSGIHNEYSKIRAQLRRLLPVSGAKGLAEPAIGDFFQSSLRSSGYVVNLWKTATALASLEHYQNLLTDNGSSQASRWGYFTSLPADIKSYIEQSIAAAIDANKAHGRVSVEDLEDDPQLLLQIIDRQGRSLLEQMQDHLRIELKEEQQLAALSMLNDHLNISPIAAAKIQGLLDHLSDGLRQPLIDAGILLTPDKVRPLLVTLLKDYEAQCRGKLRDAFDPADTKLRGFPRSFVSANALNTPDLRNELTKPIDITYVAAECSGVLKQGGLAEAVYGLAESMTRQNPANTVRLIMPAYDLIPASIKRELQLRASKTIQNADGSQSQVYKAKLGNIRLYLIENPKHFHIQSPDSTVAPSIYGPDGAAVAERFAGFADGAAELVHMLSDKTDVIHLHDWHAAAVSPLLKKRHPKEWESGDLPPVVFTFHNNNGAAQGIYSGWNRVDILQRHGISDRDSNFLVEALRGSDAVTTVSETFAQEAQGPLLGANIQHEVNAVAAQGKLTGILNGSNPSIWNPETDAQLKGWTDPLTSKAIDLSYGPDDDIMAKRAAVRTQLSQYLAVHAPKVDIDLDKPIITYVGRYDAYQKGLDMLEPAIEEALASGAQFICMGSQEDDRAKKILDRLQSKYPKGVWIIRDKKGSNGRYEFQQGSKERPGIGSLVRAATDFSFVPSEFEPCGLVQFEGWLFGNMTIASATGGLADSVIEDGEHANGFLFPRREKWLSDPQKNLVRQAVSRALDSWARMDADERQSTAKRVMEEARAYSWSSSPSGLSPAEKYRLVYAAAAQRSQQRTALFFETQLGNSQ